MEETNKRVMLSIEPKKTYVILMGASEFKEQENKWLPLPAVKRNIWKLKRLLTNDKILGVPSNNITKIIDEPFPCEIINQLIESVFKDLETLIIYYAGHGTIGDNRKLYLVTKNTVPYYPEYTALAFETIKNIATGKKFRSAKNLIFILDCCLSGSAKQESFIIGEGQKAFIMTASSSHREAISLHNECYTAFTGKLINILSPGIKEINKNTLTLGDIFQHLKIQFIGKRLPKGLWKEHYHDNFPEPDSMGLSGAEHLRIVHNKAYKPPKLPARKPKSSAYVSNYEYDIFVSFARVDNEPLPGIEEKWVTTLIDKLESSIKQRVTTNQTPNISRDDELGDISVTDETIEKIENSAILLLILSPGYLASEWCVSVCQSFLKHAGKNSGRVFIIQREMVEYPTELSDSKCYKFYKQIDGTPIPLEQFEPFSTEYSQKINCLAIELTYELEKLKVLEIEC